MPRYSAATEGANSHARSGKSTVQFEMPSGETFITMMKAPKEQGLHQVVQAESLRYQGQGERQVTQPIYSYFCV